jgi:DNA-binding phage protein
MSNQGDEEFDPDQMMEMEDGMDLGELLGSMLTDDDGRNVVNALDDIKAQLEMTNKLLLKLVVHLAKTPSA